MISTVLLAITFIAAPTPARDRPLLAEELAAVALKDGDRLEVLGRYRSLVGPSFSVDRCEATFEIEPGSRFEVFRRPNLRELLLLIETRVSARADGKGLTFHVLDLHRGPEPRRFFKSVRPTLPEISPRRQRAILSWALDWGTRTGNKRLFQEATEQFITSVGDLMEKEQGATAEILEWFRMSDPVLRENPDWVNAIVAFANRHREERDLAPHLVEFGLIEDSDAWRPRPAFLHEVGLLELEGRVVTKERAHLERAISGWIASNGGSPLLRGRTAAQYEQHAAAGEVVEGMNRAEALRAWGYPVTVTWARRQTRLFEGWFYPDRSLYLVGGLLFAWEE
ncbi:MAG: hypothetical protein ACE5GW_09565 [Planctomycetota bacterium]